MFRTLRALPVIVALTLFSLPAFAEEGSPSGFNLELDLGVSKFFDGGPTGFGVMVRPGYRLPFGLVLEGAVGHHSASKNGVRQSVTPFVFGPTFGFNAGPVRPFVGAHVGLAAIRVAVPNLSVIGFTPSATTTTGAFNIGGGADYMITDSVGVGAGIWYWAFFNSAASSMLNVGAHVAYTF